PGTPASRMCFDRKTLENPPGGGGRVRRFGEGRRPRGDLASLTVGGTTTEDARSPLPGRDPVVSVRRIGEAAADAPAGRVRLLVVHRDEVAGRQLQRQLHEFGGGFEVAVAGRLSTALAHLATSPTDAVLADLSLPDSN